MEIIVSGFGNGVGSDAGVLAIGEETSLKRPKSGWELSDVQPIAITPLNPINNKNRQMDFISVMVWIVVTLTTWLIVCALKFRPKTPAIIENPSQPEELRWKVQAYRRDAWV